MKLATWNTCLGMLNKKDYIYNTLRSENVEICMLQEVEIKIDFPTQLLSSADYKIEKELCNNTARTAIVIKNNIDYKRRLDLEKEDMSLMIIDVDSHSKYRILNLYRQFNPPNNLTQISHFTEQLNLIRIASSNLKGRKLIIARDFIRSTTNLSTFLNF